MLISELDDGKVNAMKQVSRRYFLVGNPDPVSFPGYTYKLPPGWPE